MPTILGIVATVFSIAASIASIIANCRIHSVEQKINQITTHGANSPVYIVGELNITTTTIHQSNNFPLKPSATDPPTTVSR